MKLSELRDRCEIEDRHWIWTGATSGGGPHIWAPDFTKFEDGRKVCQRGPRAIWHIKTKKPIPAGHRVYRTCKEPMCINPAHIECIPTAEWGRRLRESGEWRGDLRIIARNRKTSRGRSPMTPQKVEAILASPEKGHRELARELGVPHGAVARVRSGEFTSLTPVGSVFAGLFAMNDNDRRAA